MNLQKLKKLTPRTIGHIGVDAGIVWIGDPCYIIHRDGIVPNTMGKDWDEFCEFIGYKMDKTFCHDNGIEGLGVVTATKDGDGFYEVIGFYEDCKTPSCVMVDFNNVFKD